MKKPTLKIVLIGAGNVATQLGKALADVNLEIVQVYSRSKKSASALANKLKCSSTHQIKNIDPSGDIYIISVPDDAIQKLAGTLNCNNKIVVHTSGNTSMEVLNSASKNIGVLYPLQTFSKNRKANFEKVPMCIEANNPKTFNTIKQLAESISKNVQAVNSEQRKVIHLAAVFACNFSNHFYAIAEDLLKKNKLSLNLLQPLIAETADKIKENSPVKMQTGPAIRGDKKTIKNHLSILNDAELKKIYSLISKRISSTKKTKTQ